ncbi:MAG: hypothetical protein J5965_15340 [Aeriscardovia sp.]|nr:hypothetical protein [Aeriscardovia sp.]
MAEIYQIPESGQGNAGFGNIPFSIPVGGFGGGGFFGGNGFGNDIGGLITLAIVASIFGWNNGNGFGFGGNGGGNGAAGFLSNQINNDTGRELIMQAITNQGEASRTATQTLSTMLGQDFNLVNTSIQGIQNTLNTIGANQGMNALQVINAIQSGNASLASQFQQCCCQNQLAMCQQTNTLQQGLNANAVAAQQGFSGVQQSIAAKSAADQLAMCQQTYALSDTMNRNYLNLDNKIDAMESSRKDREITSLTAQVAKLESQNFTAGIVQQAVAPLNAQLNGLAKEVDDIKCKLPETVSVQWPNLVAVNASPYVSGGFYPNGYNGFGNGNLVF